MRSCQILLIINSAGFISYCLSSLLYHLCWWQCLTAVCAMSTQQSRSQNARVSSTGRARACMYACVCACLHVCVGGGCVYHTHQTLATSAITISTHVTEIIICFQTEGVCAKRVYERRQLFCRFICCNWTLQLFILIDCDVGRSGQTRFR